ncbi:MAG: ABC transporter permease [Myxococcota bacterium]
MVGLGRTVLSVWQYLAEFLALLVRTLRSAASIHARSLSVIARVTMMQLFFTGFQAVLPLTLAAVALGTLVLSISLEYLPVDYVQGVASIVITREVVPLVTAFLIIGRSGTAITIEIGNMQLNDELRALQVMSIPIEQFIMLPRLLGMVLAFLLLQVYANVFGLLGGYYIAAAVDLHLPSYPVADLLQGIDPADFLVSCIKAILFGTVISLTAIQHGMQVERSRREIPIVTSRAVVRSLLLCFLLNTAVSLSA